MNIAAAHRVQMIRVEHQEQHRSDDDGLEFFQSLATALSDHGPLEPASHAPQANSFGGGTAFAETRLTGAGLEPATNNLFCGPGVS
jgi:hypothetical protein